LPPLTSTFFKKSGKKKPKSFGGYEKSTKFAAEKSIKQLKQHLITKTKFYEKENFTFTGVILRNDSNVG
jgi:hypothetical protein